MDLLFVRNVEMLDTNIGMPCWKYLNSLSEIPRYISKNIEMFILKNTKKAFCKMSYIISMKIQYKKSHVVRLKHAYMYKT